VPVVPGMGILLMAVLFPVIALAVVAKILMRVLFFGRVGGTLGIVGFIAGYLLGQQQQAKRSAPASAAPQSPPAPPADSSLPAVR